LIVLIKRKQEIFGLVAIFQAMLVETFDDFTQNYLIEMVCIMVLRRRIFDASDVKNKASRILNPV